MCAFFCFGAACALARALCCQRMFSSTLLAQVIGRSSIAELLRLPAMSSERVVGLRRTIDEFRADRDKVAQREFHIVMAFGFGTSASAMFLFLLRLAPLPSFLQYACQVLGALAMSGGIVVVTTCPLTKLDVDAFFWSRPWFRSAFAASCATMAAALSLALLDMSRGFHPSMVGGAMGVLAAIALAICRGLKALSACCRPSTCLVLWLCSINSIWCLLDAGRMQLFTHGGSGSGIVVITWGTCATHGVHAIEDEAGCQHAADVVMRFASSVRQTTSPTRPHGCFVYSHRMVGQTPFLNKNEATRVNAATDMKALLCRAADADSDRSGAVTYHIVQRAHLPVLVHIVDALLTLTFLVANLANYVRNRILYHREGLAIGPACTMACYHYVYIWFSSYGLTSLYWHVLSVVFRGVTLHDLSWALTGVAFMFAPAVVACIGRSRLFQLTARRFNRKYAQQDGAFIAALLDSSSVRCGQPWWVHMTQEDARYPAGDKRRHWRLGRITTVETDCFRVQLQARSARRSVLTQEGASGLEEEVLPMSSRECSAEELMQYAKDNLRCIGWSNITRELMTDSTCGAGAVMIPTRRPAS